MTHEPVPLDRAVKNLISESALVFDGLTRLSTSVQDAARAYRSALIKCVRDMDSGNDLSDVVKASVALLHLCEILYFSTASTLLPYAFGAWVQEHYGSLELEELDDAFLQLQSHVSLDTSDDDATYWPTIIQLVISGHGRKAWELLSRTTSTLHSKYAPSLASLRHLLVHMPTTASDASFNWTAWNDAILHLLQNDPLALSDAHIRLLLELLSGQHLDQHARSWHQQVVAKCLFEDPKAHLSAPTTGRRIVQRLEAAFPSTLPPFEQIVLLLLQYDLTSALEHIHGLSAASFPWFLAHLADLLIRQGELAPTETFVLAFVRSSLVAIESDFAANKLLDICSTYHLPQAAAAIASDRGRAWEAKQNVAIALTWYLRANNMDAINSLCDAIVKQDIVVHTTCSNPQLDAAAAILAEAPTLSQTVDFVVKYHNVTLVLRDLAHLQSIQNDDGGEDTQNLPTKCDVVQRDAARRLAQLCTHCSVPRHLWHSTWTSLVPLLQKSPPVFTSVQLFGLLEALQDREIALETTFETCDHDNDLLGQLHRAIAVCLSQTLLVEGY
ncbi:hypothetical protein DYB34_011489 [Aphanomyces astaci]|uniref:Nuclear pore complex protein Nup85 n=1 Tax=Aphanomyces astaci TaxID=112090 RepID=A0A3R6ZFV2_APHAT|nr:hypothetical protein DYB34_011489 [Aphanomyces astaci]